MKIRHLKHYDEKIAFMVYSPGKTYSNAPLSIQHGMQQQKAFHLPLHKCANSALMPQSKSPPKKTRQGFSLVELVVAAAILLLATGALIYTFEQSKHNSVLVKNSLSALHIAREEVEILRAGSYSNISSNAPVALSNTVLSALGGTKQCDVITTNNYKVVTLTINWTNPLKATNSVITLKTIICNTN